MTRPAKVVGLGLVMAGALSQAARADEPPRWHGFFTSGATFTDSSDSYDHGLTRRADFSRLTRLGLNIEKRLDDRWDFAAQLVAHDSAIDVDWAFASWYPTRFLTLRVGKQKAPVWLTSDHIDVGHTYPWVSPPIEVYSLNPIATVPSVGASSTIPLGSIDLTLDAIASGYAEGTGSSRGAPEIEDVSLTFRNLKVFNLTLGNEEMQLRAAYAGADVGIKNDEFEVKTLHANFGAVGVKVDKYGFLLLSEYAYTRGHIEQSEIDAADQAAAAAAMQAQTTGSPLDGMAAQAAGANAYAHHASLVGGKGWYGTVGYQLGDFLPFVTGARQISPDDSLANGSQVSGSGGLKYYANATTDIKLQGQHVWPKDDSRGMFDSCAGTKCEQANVYSAAVNVAF